MSKDQALELKLSQIGKPIIDDDRPRIIILRGLGGVIIIIVLGSFPIIHQPGVGPCVKPGFKDIVNDMAGVSKINIAKDQVLLNIVDKSGNSATLHIFDNSKM